MTHYEVITHGGGEGVVELNRTHHGACSRLPPLPPFPSLMPSWLPVGSSTQDESSCFAEFFLNEPLKHISGTFYPSPGHFKILLTEKMGHTIAAPGPGWHTTQEEPQSYLKRPWKVFVGRNFLVTLCTQATLQGLGK